MCMKNINVSAIFCDKDNSEIGGLIQLGEFIDEITVTPLNGEPYSEITNLTVITFVSAISSSDDPDLQNEYDILWTFEPIVPDENGRIQLAIDTLDLKRNKFTKNDSNVTRNFSNQIYKLRLRNLRVLSVNTTYLLKIFLKKKGDKTFEIQSISSIKVIT